MFDIKNSNRGKTELGIPVLHTTKFTKTKKYPITKNSIIWTSKHCSTNALAKG
jgi:hypothetical protein